MALWRSIMRSLITCSMSPLDSNMAWSQQHQKFQFGFLIQNFLIHKSCNRQNQGHIVCGAICPNQACAGPSAPGHIMPAQGWGPLARIHIAHSRKIVEHSKQAFNMGWIPLYLGEQGCPIHQTQIIMYTKIFCCNLLILVKQYCLKFYPCIKIIDILDMT